MRFSWIRTNDIILEENKTTNLLPFIRSIAKQNTYTIYLHRCLCFLLEINESMHSYIQNQYARMKGWKAEIVWNNKNTKKHKKHKIIRMSLFVIIFYGILVRVKDCKSSAIWLPHIFKSKLCDIIAIQKTKLWNGNGLI